MTVGDLPAEARIKPSLKQAWQNIWPNFWMLLAFAVIVIVLAEIPTIPNYIAPAAPGVAIGTMLSSLIVSFLVVVPLGAGVIQAHFATSRGEKAEWSHLAWGFKDLRRWAQLILLGLLAALIVMVGFILLIIPGIYLAVRLTFATYRFVHDDLDAIDAIKASWEDTKGRWWNVFGLGLMAVLLVIAGLLALGVGMFVAMVLVQQMTAVYWRAIGQAD